MHRRSSQIRGLVNLSSIAVATDSSEELGGCLVEAASVAVGASVAVWDSDALVPSCASYCVSLVGCRLG